MPGEGSIQVICACGKKLRAPATSVGKKARCPACGAVVVLAATLPAKAVAVSTSAKQPVATARKVPAHAAVSPRPVVSIGATRAQDDDDGLGALYELAEQANAAPPPVDAARCPQCMSEMEDDAVLCTDCGYDIRTGKALSTTSGAKPAKPSSKVLSYAGGKKPIDRMAPQGSLVIGLLTSAAFALVASLVWVVVAWLTGYAIGYIAILIGGAAGLGMLIGQRGYSSAGGSTAAGMTVCAILFAKIAVIEILLIHMGIHRSIFDLKIAALCMYLFSPISLIFMVIGMGAAYRTANGSVVG